MAEKKTLLTYAGLKALEEELENLKVVRRKEVAEMCIRDRDKGDNWNYTFANYLGDNGNVWNNASTAFIDPAMATDCLLYTSQSIRFIRYRH